MIVYQVIYKPWVDNTEGKPWLYIGSDSKNRKDYMGSVSSREWKEFWKKETKDFPERFEKIPLASLIEKDRLALLDLELHIQEQYNVVDSSVYFNKAYASKGCFGDKNNRRIGTKHSEETKRKMAISRANRKPISKETRKKMSEAAKKRILQMQSNGEKPKGMTGKTHSKEAIQKFSSSLSKLKWWTDGKINKRTIEQPGQNWVKGRIK